MDTAYRVSFVNDLTNCYGKLFSVCQRSIVVRAARSRERAIEAAKIRFARLERIRNWALHAERIEVHAVPPEAANVAVHEPSSRRMDRPPGMAQPGRCG